MTKGYVLSPRAQTDLEEIWDYSAEHWGLDQTDRYIRALWHAMNQVAAQPSHGRSCDEVRLGYYKYLVGSHVIFYRPTASGVDVVRVLHSRMDFERHL